jgi:hypothetical protein
MNRLSKFFALPATQRRLLIKATALLATVRVLLAVLPFHTVRSWLDSASRHTRRLAIDVTSPERLAWAVGAAGNLVPGGGHCLSQALALQIFLLRRGYPCKVCFGVRRDCSKDLAAHAWLEHNGVVLIGGGALDRFVELMSPTDTPS